MAKTSVVDYVVVHELCHIKHNSHSKAFWKEVKTIQPNYMASKEWLRLHDNILKI